MKVWLVLILSLSALCGAEKVPPLESTASSKKVYILPIRDDIMPPLVYLVRRGVKDAMEANADLLVLDMDTNGGRIDTTREIISILEQFKGETLTYVNKNAFSAGAFISVATKHIYMAPGSVIGAAAPVMMSPGGGGIEKMPDTYEKKMISAVKAMVRTSAEKNGYNIAVVEAMIDKDKGLTVDDQVIAKEGEILTLTNTEAEKEYGTPPKPLLSSGTVASLDKLLDKLGYGRAERHEIKPTGVEQIGTWLNAISPLLLIIGVIGIYIEFKTPGFGVPGIVGIAAFALYFFGGYIAGLSGLEWVVVFILGLALVAVEFFLFPGTIAIGIAGAVLMLAAIVMAMVDVYPGMPSIPSLPLQPSLQLSLQLSLRGILIAMVGAAIGIWILSLILPKTSLYQNIVSQSASGVMSDATRQQQKVERHGQVGITISKLRPGGKAQFGEQILDVISQGDMVPKGTKVKIIGYSGTEALVEVVH